MIRRLGFLAFALLFPVLSYGQAPYAIPLERLNTSLAVPAMTARDDVVYIAYRAFDWLKQSDQLGLLAYDLRLHKLLRKATIPAPKVQGPRATNGLALSQDGKTLAYVEIYEPSLVLIISAGNLSELRRTNALPFTDKDHRRTFAGFDAEDNLSFASVNQDKPRFIRMSIRDFKVVSDTHASSLSKTIFPYFTWDPMVRRFWLPDGGHVLQFTEDGQPTGEELTADVPQVDQSAISLGETGVLALYAMVSRGSVATYTNHRSQVLELPCSPRLYGLSNDHAYAGVICVTQPDQLPEAGGLQILTSEFLLLRTAGPQIVWRKPMIALGGGDDSSFEWASPVIEHRDEITRIVVPTKGPEVKVYELVLPNDRGVGGP